MSSWLPAELTLSACGGNWATYLAKLYDIFRTDFLKSQPSLIGKVCIVSADLAADGKEEIFWHLITEEQGGTRVPSMRRCERLCWVRPMIEGVPPGRTNLWTELRPHGVTRVLVALNDFSHLVVLKDIKKNLLLITAFDVAHQHQRTRLQVAWQADPSRWPSQKK
jgi:hypothetical protein